LSTASIEISQLPKRKDSSLQKIGNEKLYNKINSITNTCSNPILIKYKRAVLILAYK